MQNPESPITLPALEQAINYWRNRLPAQGEDARLCAEAAALAVPYADMIMAHAHELPRAALSEAARAAFQQWEGALKEA
ncbi:MAG: DUF3717 domain-containing protein [Bordetella sp.]|nr:DUF3717 domain-containing protein [Bordetella sp.]